MARPRKTLLPRIFHKFEMQRGRGTEGQRGNTVVTSPLLKSSPAQGFERCGEKSGLRLRSSHSPAPFTQNTKDALLVKDIIINCSIVKIMRLLNIRLF
jgi:hypothetical protein